MWENMFGFFSAKLKINTEGAIKNGQSRETGNIGYTRHKPKTKKNISKIQYFLDTI